jgi:hypothetical protein
MKALHVEPSCVLFKKRELARLWLDRNDLSVGINQREKHGAGADVRSRVDNQRKFATGASMPDKFQEFGIPTKMLR